MKTIKEIIEESASKALEVEFGFPFKVNVSSHWEYVDADDSVGMEYKTIEVEGEFVDRKGRKTFREINMDHTRQTFLGTPVG